MCIISIDEKYCRYKNNGTITFIIPNKNGFVLELPEKIVLKKDNNYLLRCFEWNRFIIIKYDNSNKVEITASQLKNIFN